MLLISGSTVSALHLSRCEGHIDHARVFLQLHVIRAAAGRDQLLQLSLEEPNRFNRMNIKREEEGHLVCWAPLTGSVSVTKQS